MNLTFPVTPWSLTYAEVNGAAPHCRSAARVAKESRRRGGGRRQQHWELRYIYHALELHLTSSGTALSAVPARFAKHSEKVVARQRARRCGVRYNLTSRCGRPESERMRVGLPKHICGVLAPARVTGLLQVGVGVRSG